MKKIVLLFVLFGLFIQVNAQRNYTAKKLLFSQVQKPYINYGYLYNWYAATDVRKISSSDDWVVPTEAQFLTLWDYAGGYLVAGKYKITGTIYWQTPNTGAENFASFSIRGSGQRLTNGQFDGLKIYARQWGIKIGYNFYTRVSYNNTIYDAVNGITTRDGYSIRLIYTGSGTPTEYIGNDGKIYRVVLIGTQYWMTDNLAETKYRNGDAIPEVTDNTTWAGLTTGARCVYNNDESNR